MGLGQNKLTRHLTYSEMKELQALKLQAERLKYDSRPFLTQSLVNKHS